VTVNHHGHVRYSCILPSLCVFAPLSISTYALWRHSEQAFIHTDAAVAVVETVWSPVTAMAEVSTSEVRIRCAAKLGVEWWLYRRADKSLARLGRKQAIRISKSSWMMDPTRSREMPSCTVIDLDEIRRSSKIRSWIWSIISGVVGLRTYQHPGINLTTK
jgi:hypothetical protein